MTSTRRQERAAGFTLIELMIVVAIIGILAAIAIPNMQRMQLRAKSGEGKINLAAIRDAQESYFADAGNFVPWASVPNAAGSPPGQVKVAWPTGLCNSPPLPADPGYCWVGWQPEGDVYFNYEVDTNTGVPLTSSYYFAGAEADIDGDGLRAYFGFSHTDDSGAFVSPGPFGCTQVVSPASGATMFGQVGPCNAIDSGLTVF
jgi:type IV pilus assembly protein PilA